MTSPIKWLQDFFSQYKRVHYTPTILQIDTTECTAVCLAIIQEYYKLYIPQSQLRERCGITRDGASIFDMLTAAESYGMQTEGYEVDLDHLHQMKLPAVISWSDDHFVVLEYVYPGKCLCINDPAIGPVKVPWEKAKKKYMGLLLELFPGEKFQPGGVKPLFWKYLATSLAPYKQTIFFIIALQMMTILYLLIPPFLARDYIDDALVERWLAWVPFIMGTFAIIFLLLALTIVLKDTALSTLQNRLSLMMSSKLMRHLLGLPILFFAKRSEWLIALIPNYGSTLYGNLLGKIIFVLLNTGFTFLYGFVILYYNVLIGLVGIVVVLLNLLLLLLMNAERISGYAAREHNLGIIDYQTGVLLSNIESIKISASKNFLFSWCAGPQDTQLNDLQKIAQQEIWLYSLIMALQQTAMMSLLLIGAWSIIQGQMSIGVLVGLQFLMTQFLGPIQSLSDLGFTIQKEKTRLTFIHDTLKQPLDVRILQNEGGAGLSEEKIPPSLEFKNITFGHNPIEKPLLQNLSFKCSPHHIVGVVGYSGSGKSTIAQLAAGVYPPWSGEIFYGGKQLLEYSRKQIGQTLAMASQSVFIFPGSIYENITLWDNEVPEERVVKALQFACILKEVLALNGGIYAPLKQDGINLSKGQRQRLMIARALLWEPSILILDEATSYLDSEIEEELIQGLCEQNRAILMVTHRFGMIEKCHEVLVIVDGVPVERGSPNELMAAKGVFFKLVKEQLLS